MKLALALGLSAVLVSFRAEAVPDAGPSCTAEATEIEVLQGGLAACKAQGQAEERRLSSCAERAAGDETRLSECARDRDRLGGERESVCGELGSVVQRLLLAEPLPEDLSPCVPKEHLVALGRLVADWSRTKTELEALDAFAAGETGRAPSAPRERPDSRLAELMARLLGGRRGEPPLLFRRLLVEAIERVAPGFWRRLAGQGRAAIDGWFAAVGPLDAALVESASGQAARPGPADQGPPLLTALRLVQSFVALTRCGPGTASGECRRALQLRGLLESSAPLVLQQREQAIWATDCRALEPSSILGWLQEIPAAQVALADQDWRRLGSAGFSKLYACFLSDGAAGTSFSSWLDGRLPGPNTLTDETLQRVQDLRGRWVDRGPEDLCARAARSLQTLPQPMACGLPDETRAALEAWIPMRRQLGSQSAAPLRACAALADLLWAGAGASIPPSFDRPPSAEEIVRKVTPGAPTAIARLRSLCAERRGGSSFPVDFSRVVRIAAGFGEAPAAEPWQADAANGAPVEVARFARARRLRAWVAHLFSRRTACAALGIAAARCDLCEQTGVASYDCDLRDRLRRRWERWDRDLELGIAAALLLVVLLAWAVAVVRARRRVAPWIGELVRTVEAIGLSPREDPWRWLRPARFGRLAARLPAGLAWERWGSRAAIVRAAGGGQWTERDVGAAGSAARDIDAELALLIHDEGAAPQLGAVRSMLEWAARGPGRAVHVFPVPADRLRWARGSDDLLDLVEQTSLRGNPFEVRGRITSSSQFFDRERLVSGLLASAQSGHWILVTGLRRFGKSSLALEVSRRLTGPSAYVDLAGFHHELAQGGDAASDAILRYVCVQLDASARSRSPREPASPALPAEGTPLDASRLAEWLHGFSRAYLAATDERPAAAVLVLDEIEQALGGEAKRVEAALASFSVAIGRLRAALGDPALAGGLRTGVLLCGAFHPVLWAPLPTLGGQSLAGAFPRLCVPRLPDDAALAMMRALGARQGIRFAEPAVELLVRESQGVPLLVRRVGSAVLELYDPERARQGALGAMEIGMEGVRAALRREGEKGAPSRVWIESEIADSLSPVGVALRTAARERWIAVGTLRAVVSRAMESELARLGLDRLLVPEEFTRRADEAGGVIVEALVEAGVLEGEGDSIRPERLGLPDGLLRRVLGGGASDRLPEMA